jgi:hypothetical protein
MERINMETIEKVKEILSEDKSLNESTRRMALIDLAIAIKKQEDLKNNRRR